MKTQILTLESHDDLISVRDRLSWTKTPRVLLVWPGYEDVSLRELDLKVLQRHANSLGAQLGLVTRRASVRREAEALGLPVFESTAIAQKDAWPARAIKKESIARPPRQDLRRMQSQARTIESGWRTNPGLRFAAFSIGVLAVLLVAALFVPRASVTLQPESQVQSLVIPVIASPAIQSVFVTGSVPAGLETLIVEGSQTLPISGQITIPQTKARGIARFENLTDAEVRIPAGTVIFTLGESPVRFATVNATHITAGIDQFVEVPIEAIRAGSLGNLPANALQAIEGSVGLSASVTNAEPTAGGSDQTAVGAGEAERMRLREALMRDLTSQAEVNFQGQVLPNDLLLLDTLKVSQTLDESYSPPADQPGSSLTLNMRLEFAVLVVSTDDLKQLAQAALDANSPQGFSPVADSLTFISVSAPVTDADGTTRWQMKTERRLLRNVDTTQVLSIV
ncbi:MAG TPA: baseplate J/gp47 family protein, partial [Anaerolineales bacterium]